MGSLLSESDPIFGVEKRHRNQPHTSRCEQCNLDAQCANKRNQRMRAQRSVGGASTIQQFQQGCACPDKLALARGVRTPALVNGAACATRCWLTRASSLREPLSACSGASATTAPPQHVTDCLAACVRGERRQRTGAGFSHRAAAQALEDVHSGWSISLGACSSLLAPTQGAECPLGCSERFALQVRCA